jgi:hypothetical protein
VLGNPPWERIKLQEEEFFATRHHDVAEARNKADRTKRIQWLSEGMLARDLYPDLAQATHEDEAEKVCTMNSSLPAAQRKRPASLPMWAAKMEGAIH